MHVYHVFPYPWYVSGGHSNGIRAFIESQVNHGLNVQAISPGPDPAQVQTSIPQLDISSDDYSRALRTLNERQLDCGTDVQTIRRSASSLIKTSNSIPQLACPVKYLNIEQVDWQKEVPEILSKSQDKVVFHLHDFGKHTCQLSYVLSNYSVRYAYTSHGELHYRNVSNFIKKFSYMNFVNFCIRNASGIHLLTKRERDRLKYIIPCWRGRTLVQPHIISLPSEASIHTPTPRSQHGIPDSVFLFLFFGRLDIRQKGLDILLKAFSRLPEQYNCHLAFVGPDFQGGKKELAQLSKTIHSTLR